MRVMSFDIGIKTLSFAVFDTTASDPLVDWKIFNMCERKVVECCHSGCEANVKFELGDKMYCKRHAKQVPGGIMPTTRLSPTQLSKMNIDEVLGVARELSCTPPTKPTKKATIAAIRAHYAQHTLVNYEPPKASDVDMVTLAQTIQRDLSAMLPSSLEGYTALIENQLGATAVRMRCMQAMLTMHLLHEGCTDIQYVSPRRKLEDRDVDTSTYSARKKAARDAIPSALQELRCDKRWLGYFQSHKKKDDLADAFLQGRWYLLKHCPELRRT